MKSRNWIVLCLLLFFLVYGIQSETCLTRFYAEAVTAKRATELDIYFSRAQVETATDCAIFCGKRQFCRSAVYNHDTRSCALSYDKVVECNTQKQRYNTFHLTTDGGESISIITCVELCKEDKPKFQDSKPSTLFSRNEPHQSIDQTNSAARLLSQLGGQVKSDSITPEHGSGQSGNFVAISKGHLKTSANGKHELPPEIIDSDTPSTVIIEALQRLMHEVNETGRENSNKNTEKKAIQSGQLIGKIQTQAELNTKHRSEVATDNEMERVNALGLKHHQKAPNSTLKLTDHRENKLTAKDLITTGVATSPLKRVMFNAKPLVVEEIFNGTSNLSSQEEVYHSGGTQDHKSGGFFKWLKPGEKFTLPPEVNLPPEVAKLVPQLLNAVGREEVGRIRGKGLSFEITEKDTMPKPTNKSNSTEIEELKRTLTRFAKIKVEDEEEKESKEQIEHKIKEVFDKAASSIDQIIVNGRILTADEIKNLKNKEISSSTTTTTVKPWKPASQLFGASEEDDEEDPATTSTTTKLPDPNSHPHQDSKPGFLNTFLIQGISSIMHRENDASEPQHHHLRSKPRINSSETTTIPFTTTVPSTTSSGPIVCYRQIPQQVLLYAAFQTLHGISLNECRCRCAETWLNFTSINDDIELSQHRCKSILYNDISRECSLNRGDHNGKYDLIYDKFIDYHYVSCDIKYLLSAARRVCAKILPNIAQNLPSPLQIHRPTDNDQNTSEHLLRDQQSSTGFPPPTKSILTKNLISTVTREIPTSKLEKIALDEAQIKSTNQLSSVTQKIPSVNEKISTTDKVEVTTSTQKVGETTDDSDLLINELITDKPSANKSPKIVEEFTTTNAPKTILVVDSSEKRISTSLREKPEIFVSTDSTTSTLPLTTTTSYPLQISGYTDGCFEVIEGFMMQSTAGGLERDVESLGECQCHCANSLVSKRYSFQCSSATYYPVERDCVLNLEDRKQRPDAFMKQEVSTENVTYLGLICSQEKAIQLHSKKGQCKRELKSITSTTTTPKPVSVNTDDCFLELPSYVLEGTALAVETNVSVKECKCYCIDADRRYGADCQSFEYYYDSQTCLLNKENRISDPDRFNYDTHGMMHSYFDYRCHAEKLTLAVYVEQVCSKAIDLKISDIQASTDTSLDVEDQAHNQDNEVRLVTQTQLPISHSHETSTRHIKILKFINESEDEIRDDQSDEYEEEIKKHKKARKSKKIRHKLEKLEETTTTVQPTTVTTEVPESSTVEKTTVKVSRRSRLRNLAEIEELEGEEELKRFEATSTTQAPSTTSTTQQTTTSTLAPTTTPKPSTTTTLPSSTTTQKSYLPVGECRYSALYQTAFSGERLLKRFKVENAIQCFAGCHWERCRSANLIQSGGPTKYCELYRDSIVDFRRTDVLYFDRDTVHFDSIQCDEKPQT